jgi:hypothetical protein
MWESWGPQTAQMTCWHTDEKLQQKPIVDYYILVTRYLNTKRDIYVCEDKVRHINKKIFHKNKININLTA